MSETILAIAAHNDDHVIGAGGALAKYAREGKRVRTIICSYGEGSHPHLKRDVIIKRRVEESVKADKILSGKGVTYLGLQEGKFDLDFHKTLTKLAAIIKAEKPSKIFTHGNSDAHPDHRALSKLVMRLIETDVISCPVYSFEIWSLFKLSNRNTPYLVVDTTLTFNTKIKAFLVHESQTLVIWLLLWKLMLRDKVTGFFNGCRYAEVFARIA